MSDELLQAAKYFVAWVDDVWGSAALSPKTLAEYERAKKAIADYKPDSGERERLRKALTAIANDPIIGNEVLDPAALMYRGIAKRALSEVQTRGCHETSK